MKSYAVWSAFLESLRCEWEDEEMQISERFVFEDILLWQG